MIRSRLRPKALCLCVTALGLTAFSAGVAQAETGANWMVNGSNVTSTLLPNIELFALGGVLATQIAGTGVEYECTGVELVGIKLETEGRLTNGGKVKATGCSTFLNGTLSKVCKPSSMGQPSGTILSNALKGLLQLGTGEPIARISPSSGETLGAITQGEECSLPESVPVKGVLAMKDVFSEGKTESTTHSIGEDGFWGRMFVISNTAEHTAVIRGSLSASLGGAHLGLKWSGLPG